MRHKTIIIIFFLFILISHGYAEIRVIENPEPLYHGISSVVTLKSIKDIEEIQNDDLCAFVGILAVDTDTEGNYYVFDYKHGTIVKLNKKFEFLKTIGSKGEGPGEFKIVGATPFFLDLGLDDRLYISDFMNRKITRYTLQGKYIDEHKLENFRPFKAIADEAGNIYVPSIKDNVLDIYDKNINYKKSLLSNDIRKTFLFFKPPACAIHKQNVPYYWNIRYCFLNSGDLLLLNNLDLSIRVVDKNSGAVKKKFYLWDDYVLSEFKKKLKKMAGEIKSGFTKCGNVSVVLNLFIDDCDDFYLYFIDSKNDCYIYKLSVEGKLIRVYKVDHPGANGLRFFKYEDNKFYSFSRHGLHIFSELKK